MTEQIFDLAKDFIKNDKNQRTIILILSGLLAFGFGYFSKSCPPKEVQCKQYIKTIESQFTQLSGKDKSWTVKLNEQRDLDDNQCKVRISKELERNKNVSSIVSCEEVYALKPQCDKHRKKRRRKR